MKTKKIDTLIRVNGNWYYSSSTNWFSRCKDVVKCFKDAYIKGGRHVRCSGYNEGKVFQFDPKTMKVKCLIDHTRI